MGTPWTRLGSGSDCQHILSHNPRHHVRHHRRPRHHHHRHHHQLSTTHQTTLQSGRWMRPCPNQMPMSKATPRPHRRVRKNLVHRRVACWPTGPTSTIPGIRRHLKTRPPRRRPRRPSPPKGSRPLSSARRIPTAHLSRPISAAAPSRACRYRNRSATYRAPVVHTARCSRWRLTTTALSMGSS